MCDCYYDKCKLCGAELPIHLGDYNTGRDEIEVYCQEHIPDHNVTIFTVTEVHPDEKNIIDIGWKMGIRSLTENAKYYDSINYNYPNISSDFKVERII